MGKYSLKFPLKLRRDFTEEWLTPTRVKISNNGCMAINYAVLCYTDETKRELCDFKRVYIEVGESVTVDF